MTPCNLIVEGIFPEECTKSNFVFELKTEDENTLRTQHYIEILDINIPIIQGVPGGKVNILGGHSIGHSKQICLYDHVSYSERFPR